jgi:PKD repeat protein
MVISKNKMQRGSLYAFLFIFLAAGALLFVGCSSSSGTGAAASGETEQPMDQEMSFATASFTYYSDDQENELTISKERVTVCVDEQNMDQLRGFLQGELTVKQPLDIDELPGGIVIVGLAQGVTDEQILELIERLNQSGLIQYSTPMFTAPSTRAILTHEFIVRFKDAYSTGEIEDFIESKKVQILKRDYLWPKCYILGFTAESGSNTLDVSRIFHESEMVEYAHPNFIELMEPPDNGISVIGQGNYEIVQGEEQGFIFYPNLFLEFDSIISIQPMMITGWEVICEEDFEDLTTLVGWVNEDRDSDSGRYRWGAVSDAAYPSMPWDSYEAEGNKGWAARFHNAGYPNRWPNMANSSEGYAQNMDTWLVYGPFDLSNAFWARFRFKGAFFAPSTETFGWAASIDGENWFGNEVSGEGEDGDYFYWWPRYWRDDPPNTGMYFDLTKVPELGDLTGQEEVYVALYYKSDGTSSPAYKDDFSFYGIFIDDILIEQCTGINVPLITTDPLSNRQWALRNRGQSGGDEGVDINVVDAWSLLEDALDIPPIDDEEQGVIVAVIDEGVDLNHEDLNLVQGYDATYNPEDPDLVDSQGGANPWDAHGTCCAGIIGAKKNDIGIVGVAPGVKVMPIRIAYSPEGETYWVSAKAQQADGILWAAQHGATVLSNSWGGGFSSDIVTDAIRDVKALGCTVVFAAGNDNIEYSSFPASLDEVVAVGALSPCGERKSPDSCDGEWWWGSNYGQKLDIMAPGVLNPTTDIMGNGGYAIANDNLGITGNYFSSFNGTSSAAPYVAGVIALMLTLYPELAPNTIQDIIESTAVDIGAPGFDEQTGYGIIDAYAALCWVDEMRPVPNLVVKPQSVDFGTVTIGLGAGKNVQIKNEGEGNVATLEITDIAFSGDPIFDDPEINIVPTTPFELEKNESVQMSLYFVPDIPGSYEGTITITSNDPDEPVKEIALSGIAVEEAAPQLSVSPDTLEFSTTITQLQVTISNTGAGALEWTIADNLPLWLEVSSMEGSTTPESPAELSVEVSPGELDPGTYSHTIEIDSNGGSQALEATLIISGNGGVPHVEISASPDYGVVALEVEFSSTVIGGDGAIAYLWNFGDGSDMSDMPNPMHEYTTAGLYIATLAVTDDDADSDSDSVQVAVSDDVLIINPTEVTMDPSGDEQGFSVSEGTPPYHYELFGAEDTVDTVVLIDHGDGTATVRVNPIGLNPPSPGSHTDTTRTGTVEETLYVFEIPAGDPIQDDPIEPPDMTDTSSNATVDTQRGVSYVFLRVEDDTGQQAFARVTFFGSSGGWAKSYGGDLEEEARGIDIAQASGYFMAGSTGSFVAENYGVCHDVWIAKLSDTGEVAWEKALGTGAQEYGYSVQATSDEGCVVAGSSIHVWQAGVWIFKLNGSGAIDWHKLYKGSQFYPRDVRQDSGGYWIAGNLYIQGIGNVSTVYKIDSYGDFAWTDGEGRGLKHVFDIAGSNYNYLEGMDTTTDDGCVVAGGVSIWYEGDNQYNQDMSVMKLDSSGHVSWQKTYGLCQADEGGIVFSYQEQANSIAQTTDGGYIIGAEIYAWGSGEGEEGGEQVDRAWVVKLDSEGEVDWQKTFGGPNHYKARSVEQTSDDGYIVVGDLWLPDPVDPYGYEPSDVWIVKLNSIGGVDWHRTYGSPGDDWANSVKQTQDGGYILAGETAYGPGDRGNAWVLKLNNDGSVGNNLQSFQ